MEKEVRAWWQRSACPVGPVGECALLCPRGLGSMTSECDLQPGPIPLANSDPRALACLRPPLPPSCSGF